MKVQMIGHATILVETATLRILIDPCFANPGQEAMCEGITDIFPNRGIRVDECPDYDLIIISHQHQDHFDIATLTQLNRSKPVLVPNDPLLIKSLLQIGFSQVQAIEPDQEAFLGQTTIMATRSEVGFPEMGIVIDEDGFTVWNQVDTITSADTVANVLSRFQKVDILIAPWQPMIETNFQQNKSLQFPYELYEHMLSNIRRISPRALVPGANGFSYVGAASWLNQFVFPVSMQQFIQDVLTMLPELQDRIFHLTPGDSLVAQANEFQLRSRELTFVDLLDSAPEALHWCPVRFPGYLTLVQTELLSSEEWAPFIFDALAKIFNENFLQQITENYRKYAGVYLLQVDFIDGPLYWTIDFRNDKPRLNQGRSTVASLFSLLTSKALYQLLTHKASWDYAMLGGGHQFYHKAYKVSAQGMVKPMAEELVDPLFLACPYDHYFKAHIANSIERYSPLCSHQQTGI